MLFISLALPNPTFGGNYLTGFLQIHGAFKQPEDSIAQETHNVSGPKSYVIET